MIINLIFNVFVNFCTFFNHQELECATNHLATCITENFKLRKGDRALLVFFPGLDFTAALLACFKAGVIAVPVFPPDPRRLKKDLNHFVSIQSSSGAKVVLTNSQYNFVKKMEGIKGIFSSDPNTKWPELQWVVVDDLLKKGRSTAMTNPSKEILLELEDVAFLQYTSGSTSDPKGVMISHRNLAHNLMLITKELKTHPDTICVSWLPQYHDMGLIGELLAIIKGI